MITKASFQSRKIANTGGEWQGRRGFSRNFYPGDAMAKPQSSVLQTLGVCLPHGHVYHMVSGGHRFPGNVAGWIRA